MASRTAAARIVFRPVSALVLSLALAAPALADPDAEGRDLMTKVDARPRGNDQLLHATWRLIQKSGRERVRKTRSYWIDLRGDTSPLRSKRLIVFDTPTQLEDTAFLVWSDGRVDTDDRRWVYLPALRKTRRVAGRDRGKSFAGTDFNYEDLSDLHVAEEHHRLEGRSEDDAFWMVVSTPVDDASPYSKRVRWIHPEHYTTHRVEFYDRHERLQKTLELEWQRTDGVWTWKRLVMNSHRSGHTTVIEVDRAEHGLGFAEDLFSQHRLRAGPPHDRGAAHEVARQETGSGDGAPPDSAAASPQAPIPEDGESSEAITGSVAAPDPPPASVDDGVVSP